MVRFGRHFVLGLVLAASLLGSARAQEALSLSESQPEGPLVSADEVQNLARLAGLSSDQTEAITALREGLDADFKGAVRARQQAWDDIQAESQDHPQADQTKAYEAAARRFRSRCGEIELAFLSDVKSILTEEQASHWGDFERYRRRAHSNGWWQRPATDADLVKIVTGLGLDEAQMEPVRPLLDEYERELDPAIVARMALKREAAEIDFGSDYDKRNAWYGRAYDQTQPIDQRLAGINRKYARLITPLLPAARQEEFSTRFAAASYINLYTPSEDRKKIDAAEKLADLTESQKADLAGILGPFRKNVAVVEREAERLEDEYAYQYNYQQLTEGKSPKGYQERYNEIWAMEGKALAAIRKVLNEAQKEKIDAVGR